jgi:ankyrin repeat protein
MLMEENLDALKNALATGWDMNKVMPNRQKRPLQAAFDNNKFNVIEFLIENGADLHDPEYPPICSAARSGRLDLIDRLTSRGAELHAINRFDQSVLDEACRTKNKKEMLNHLIRLGIRISELGGKTVRSAAMHGDTETVALLLEHGADINYRISDSVFTAEETPFHAAVHHRCFETALFLLEKGANVTISNRWGYRPYHYAVEYEHPELIRRIKDHEPPEWHNLEWNIARLLELAVPQPVIDDLIRLGGQRIGLEEGIVDYIQLAAPDHVRIALWKDRLFVDLLNDIDNYDSTGTIVWLPQERCFATFDIEHDHFAIMEDFTWLQFMSNPGDYMTRILDWEYFD